MREQLGGAPGRRESGRHRGRLRHPRLARSRLVIARPARPPFDTDVLARADAAALERDPATKRPAPARTPQTKRCRRCRSSSPAATASRSRPKRVVQRESILNTVGSLALILPLLFLVFRSLWLVARRPAAVGARAGRSCSACSAWPAPRCRRRRPRPPRCCSASASTGSCCSTSSHTLALQRAARADEQAIRQLCADRPSSMLLGMWTTAATFYGLAFVDFPSLQQLGALIGHSMVLCGIAHAGAGAGAAAAAARPDAVGRSRLPGLAAWVQRRRTRHSRRGRGRDGRSSGRGIAGADQSNAGSPALGHARCRPPGAARSAFGLPTDVYLIVQRGPELEPLLESNERIAARGAPRPARGAVSRRRRRCCRRTVTQSSRARGDPGRPARARRGRRAAARRPQTSKASASGTFEPFVARLPRLLAGERAGDVRRLRRARPRRSASGASSRSDGDGWAIVSYAIPVDRWRRRSAGADRRPDGERCRADRPAARQPRAGRPLPAAVPQRPR